MNREQRRQYDRKVKHAANASVCPECKHPALFYTTSRGERDTILKCERCDAIVREGAELTRLMPPGIYLPTKLEILDKALLYEASRPEEDIAYVNEEQPEDLDAAEPDESPDGEGPAQHEDL